MKLYCGTYGKYSAGSIAGAWMDLDKYANAEEFEKACRKLHSDEREPEFMFQDVELDAGEDWQAGLYSESSIPREYWTLKKEHAAEEKAGGARAREKAEQDKLCTEYMEDREGITKESHPERWARWWKYYRKTFYFFTLSDGVIGCVGIPSIETQFCCGEDDRGQGGDGPGTMAYAQKVNAEKHTERGFTRANLERFDNHEGVVARVEEKTREYAAASEEHRAMMRSWRECDVRAVVLKTRHGGGTYKTIGSAYWDGLISRIFTEDDFARTRKAIAKVRKDFEKRLARWWKRFGADHVHTWTYWTEA